MQLLGILVIMCILKSRYYRFPMKHTITATIVVVVIVIILNIFPFHKQRQKSGLTLCYDRKGMLRA